MLLTSLTALRIPIFVKISADLRILRKISADRLICRPLFTPLVNCQVSAFINIDDYKLVCQIDTTRMTNTNTHKERLKAFQSFPNRSHSVLYEDRKIRAFYIFIDRAFND